MPESSRRATRPRQRSGRRHGVARTFKLLLRGSQSERGARAMPLVTMQAKGQMTVPQELREALGIEQGTDLVCYQPGPDVFECHVLSKPMGLRVLIERHSGPEPAPTPDEIQEIVREGILAE